METAATTQLGIEGMTCAACVTRVERALLRVPGVEDATVNLATETAQVRWAQTPGDDVQLRRAGVRPATHRATPRPCPRPGRPGRASGRWAWACCCRPP